MGGAAAAGILHQHPQPRPQGNSGPSGRSSAGTRRADRLAVARAPGTDRGPEGGQGLRETSPRPSGVSPPHWLGEPSEQTGADVHYKLNEATLINFQLKS